MNDQQGPPGPSLDATEFSRSMAEIAETSQKLVTDFLTRQAAEGLGPSDPLNIGGAFMEMTTRMMADPAKLMEANLNLWQDYIQLWQSTATRMMGGEADPVAEPATGDRRF